MTFQNQTERCSTSWLVYLSNIDVSIQLQVDVQLKLAVSYVLRPGQYSRTIISFSFAAHLWVGCSFSKVLDSQGTGFGFKKLRNKLYPIIGRELGPYHVRCKAMIKADRQKTCHGYFRLG